MTTQTSELRRDPRDPITCRAQLFYAGAWVPCLIQDISPRGFGIMSTRNFCVGQASELRFEPYPGQQFQCHIEIKHVGESQMGALVTQMNEAGRRVCMQLMRDYHSDRKARNK